MTGIHPLCDITLQTRMRTGWSGRARRPDCNSRSPGVAVGNANLKFAVGRVSTAKYNCCCRTTRAHSTGIACSLSPARSIRTVPAFRVHCQFYKLLIFHTFS
jgi:hypothetical protein